MSIKISGNTPGGKVKFSGSGGSLTVSGPGGGGGGGGGGGFDPLSIGNTLVWLKADAGAYQNYDGSISTPAGNGDYVGKWVDQSGQDNHATVQNYDSSWKDWWRPKLSVSSGINAIDFTDVSGVLGTRLQINSLNGRSVGGDVSIFVAYNYDVQGGNGNKAFSHDTSWYMGIGSPGAGLSGKAVSKMPKIGNPSWSGAPIAVGTGSKFVHSVIISSETLQEYVNSAAGQSHPNAKLDTIPVDMNNPIILGRDTYDGFSLNGHIYEVLIYNKALSAGEQASVEGYLKTKYSI
jgi:hypothetical protein